MSTVTTKIPPNRVLRVAQRAASAPSGFLEGLGRQVSFYIQTVATVPRTIRRYRLEVLRLLAEVSMGSGALAVIGGTVVVVSMLSIAVGYEVGQQGTTSLGRIGLGAFAGYGAGRRRRRRRGTAIADLRPRTPRGVQGASGVPFRRRPAAYPNREAGERAAAPEVLDRSGRSMRLREGRRSAERNSR